MWVAGQKTGVGVKEKESEREREGIVRVKA